MEYVNAISDMGNALKGGSNTKNTIKLTDAHNRILLVADGHTVDAMYDFEACITPNVDVNVKKEYDIRLHELMKLIRADLFASHKVNKRYKDTHFLSGIPQISNINKNTTNKDAE